MIPPDAQPADASSGELVINWRLTEARNHAYRSCYPCIKSGPRRVVLVALPFMHSHHDRLPIGHASLVAALKDFGSADVRTVVFPVYEGADRCCDDLVQLVLEQMAGFDAMDVDVAVGVYIWNDHLVRLLLERLRVDGFNGRIILGGPQITYCESGLEAYYPEADAFVRGYGEDALGALTASPARQAIPGVHYAGEADMKLQAAFCFNERQSPWLDGTIMCAEGDSVLWETQRGCSFTCSFCQHRQAESTITSRPKIKPVPQNRLDREIDLLCDRQVSRISVSDPVFNMDEAHACHVLSRFIENGYKGELSLQCRPEMIRERFLSLAQKLDVTLEFGIQSIDPVVYKACSRRNNLNEIRRVLSDVSRMGIKHEVSLIYGLPEQTLKSFRDSINWCLEACEGVIKAYPLLMLRGTRLEIEKARWQLEVDGRLSVVVSSSTFNRSDWEEMDKIAQELANTNGRRPATGEPKRSVGKSVDSLGRATRSALSKGECYVSA